MKQNAERQALILPEPSTICQNFSTLQERAAMPGYLRQ